MKGSIRDIKRDLAEAILCAKKAKAAIKFITESGRLLVSDADFHQIQDLVLMGGNDFATMDSNLGEWKRVGVFSDKFVAAREKVN